MKYSQFNSIIPYRNKFALYNAYEDKVIFLEEELKNILVAEIKNIDNLKNIHPDFFDYLSENNFLVSNKTDELKNIKKLVYQIDNDERIFDLTINPTVNCNFRCWYCYETHEHSKMSSEIIKRTIELMRKIAQKQELKYFSLSFFGGEPLLYFEKVVVPIIDNAIEITNTNNKDLSIGFTTNGFLIDDKFINYFKINNLKPHFQITLDGYRENHDKVRFVSKHKGSYFTIINNIKKLVENEMFVRVRINFTDENIDDTYKIADDLLIIEKKYLKKYLLIDFHRVWQNSKVDDIDIIVDKNVMLIKEKGFEVKSSSYNVNTVGGSCYADKKNSAVINYNGDVFKCTARDFKTENREGYLTEKGDIIWENDSLKKRMKIKFNNQPCLHCRLLAICNGSCSQQALDHFNNSEYYCVYSSNDMEKDKVIKAKVDLIVQQNETTKN
jgi:uncharacterized protein